MIWDSGVKSLVKSYQRLKKKKKKIVLDACLLITHPWSIPYNANWSNPEKRVVLSPTPQCN